jgi:hypothetical protein
MWCLFLSSYTPLFCLIGLRSVGRSTVIATASGGLIIAGAIGTFLFLRTAPKKPGEAHDLHTVESSDRDVVAYVATYLLPFVTVFTGEWQDIASLAALVAFLGLLYVQSRLIYVNPIFALMGYHLFRVISSTADGGGSASNSGVPRYVLADTRQIRAGRSIWAHRVSDDLLLYDGGVNVRGEDQEGQEDEGEDVY